MTHMFTLCFPFTAPLGSRWAARLSQPPVTVNPWELAHYWAAARGQLEWATGSVPLVRHSPLPINNPNDDGRLVRLTFHTVNTSHQSRRLALCENECRRPTAICNCASEASSEKWVNRGRRALYRVKVFLMLLSSSFSSPGFRVTETDR